jgi:hypothetical protein
MTEFKSFDSYKVKLSEIASGSLKVPAQHQPVIDAFVQSLIAEVLLMRKDVEVDFAFNLNMGTLYFGLSKSFPFIHNDFHEFLYPLDGSKTIAEVIDETMEESVYHKTSLPIKEFTDLFVNIKAFDDLFDFNGELYEHMKTSSFSYTNMGHKDTFKDMGIVRVFGHSPGVSFKMNGIKVNVNNSCWIFDFEGVNLNIKQEQFHKLDAADCIKGSLLSLYNLSCSTNYKSLSCFKY